MAETCVHDDLSQLHCEPEGYENPTEPLQIRITCQVCGRHFDAVIQDVPLQDWTLVP